MFTDSDYEPFPYEYTPGFWNPTPTELDRWCKRHNVTVTMPVYSDTPPF